MIQFLNAVREAAKNDVGDSLALIGKDQPPSSLNASVDTCKDKSLNLTGQKEAGSMGRPVLPIRHYRHCA
jgi:hypothetical protein